MPQLTILHTTSHDSWGGLEKRIFNESVWMSNKGHKLIIAAPKASPLYQRARSHGLKVYPVAFKKSAFITDYFKLVGIFKSERPHVLNTHGNTDSKIALPAGKHAGINCRILSRHISAHVSNNWYNRLLYKMFSHYTFTTAHCTTNHLQTTFDLDKAQVMSMASGIIEPSQLPSRDQAHAALAENLGVDAKTRFIGFVGRVSHDKGVDLILDAFRQLADHIPHHLVIVGTGIEEYLSQLQQMAEDFQLSHRIHFPGFTDNVWPIYRALELKVLASREKNGIPFEGIPQAVLEAMYAGCPVVGSNSGGIADIIHHGTTGLLFDIDNPGQLAEMMMDSISNPTQTQKRSQRARKHVQTHHTIDAMGEKTLEIYNNHYA